MPLLTKKRVVAAAIESTIGTAESLADGDGAFNAFDAEIQASIDVEEREGQGAFNRLPGVPGGRMGTATFKTDMAIGSTQPLWASVLLPGCGFVGSSAYTPRTEAPGSNVKTLTIGVYKDGKLETIAGAVGNCKMVFPNGRMAYCEWEFQGVYQDDADTSIIDPTHPTAKPPRFASATITYNSNAQKVEQVTLDFGNVIKMREDPATSAGYISGIITDRYPKITANPESVLAATEDRYDDWINCTEAAFALTCNGPSSSSVAISAPKASIINKQSGDREGLQIDDIEWACNANGDTEDSEVTITVTAES